MTREKFGVLLDAKDKLCGSCDAVYCDTCYVPKLIEKHRKIVYQSESPNKGLNNDYITVLTEILKIRTFFNLTDLYIMFEKEGITDRAMINHIVDDLTDSGRLKYSEIKKDIWAFEVVADML